MRVTANVAGLPLELALDRRAGVVTLVRPIDPRPDLPYALPRLVDSHVHLSYAPIAADLRHRGVGVVVDLAAPLEATHQPQPLTVLHAGPMLTGPGGYPQDSWGADGYGWSCADVACVKAFVDARAAAGGRVIKLAFTDNGLPEPLALVAVARAHAHGLKVAAHALSDDDAARAAVAGCDVLAHTPVEPLTEATVRAWRDRAVISTLAAFPSGAVVDNLRRLRAAGALVLYGTDLGNTTTGGPSEAELAALSAAGLDAAAIVASMTHAPRAFWGLPAGTPTVGEPLDLAWFAQDPNLDARALLRPVEAP